MAQLDEAKKRLADRKEITQASPSSMARVHVASAYNYSALEQYEIAVTECNKALELDSHCAYAYGMRGSAYSDLGNYDKGIADCSKAINIEPDDPVHYMQRARIYRYMQRLDLALRDKEQEQRCWKKMDEEKVQREKIAEENRQKELELAYIKMHKNDPEALKLLRGQLTTDSH